MATSKLSATSLLDGGGVEKEGGTGKDESSSGRPARSVSPEVAKCAICLGDVVNRSCSNSCAHQFCFGCLLEWSKVKPECPLCKMSFRTICHNFRGNDEHDEYQVPTPVPHLSIRFTASGTRFSHPFIQVLEARTPFSSHVSRAFDALSMPSSGLYQPPPAAPVVVSSNPFNSNFRPETFGDFISEHRRVHEEAIQMPGYQNRRRRYDRNEWVQPFGSTLQPGSVIFPSVEYVRSHPSVSNRLRSWLYRELNVLLGLHRSRDQMAFVYDLIMHLINHYDVRSQDFRDMVHTYFAAKTAHFQHELYHYIISGMGMEEYDRVAEYPSNGNNGGGLRRNAPPEVITLDSDDEGRQNSNLIPRPTLQNSSGDVIILDSSSDEDESPIMLRPIVRPRDAVSTIASIQMPSLMLGGSSRAAADQPEEVESYPREENERDPDMPVLVPQVFRSFDLRRFDEDGTIDGPSTSSSANAVTTPPISRVITNEPVNQNLVRPSVLSRSSGRLERVLEPDFDINLDVSVESYSSPPRHTSRPLTSPDFPILQLRRNMDRNSEWEMDRTMPNFNIASVRTYLGIGTSGSRPSTSGRGETSSAFVPYEPESSHSVREDLIRPPRPSCIHGTSGDSSAGMQQSSSSRDCRSISPSPAFRIDLYPRGISSSQVMDLSRSAGLVSATNPPSRGLSSRSPTACDLTSIIRTPPLPGTSSQNLPGPSRIAGSNPYTYRNVCARVEDKPVPEKADESESDELECLGAFPIQKKPPLAVITLSSSEDEDESNVKTESKTERLNINSSDEDTSFLDNFLNQPESPNFHLLGDLCQFPDLHSSSSSSSCLPIIPPQQSSSSFSGIRNRKTSSAVIQFPTIPCVKFSSSSTSSSTVQPNPTVSGNNNPSSSSNVSTDDRSRKKHRSSPAKKSKKKTRCVSSSDESGDEESTSTKQPSPIVVRLPKKRKYPLIANIFNDTSESSDDGSKSENDSDSDYSASTSSKRKSKSPSDKKRSSSKKKHKSKSKKSKKSKKGKDKDKTTKSHKRTRHKSPSGATPSTSSSGASRPSRKMRKTEDPASRNRSKTMTMVQDTSTESSPSINFSSSSLTVMPVCDFESPSNLLDLSLNSSRTEDVIPNDDPVNLRAPSRPPIYHFGDSSVSLPSTVEVSVFSPSRYCWNELLPSASDSRNTSERDWDD